MEQYIIVGTITSTHGLKGEVKIYPLTDFGNLRFSVGNELYIHRDNEYKKFIIKSHRTHKDFDLVCFEGYDDINKIEPYVKSNVYITEDQLHDLDEDEFYYFELTNCEVYHEKKLLGKVVDVVNYGASDIIVLKNDTGKEIMIPFVDEFIEEVDLENKKIYIQMMEGLLGETDEN